jgi:hypothetical protein
MSEEDWETGVLELVLLFLSCLVLSCVNDV